MTNTRQLFLQHVAQTSDAPLLLEIDRAEGMYLYAPDGKQYIDLVSGVAVSNLGHCHPAVVQAVQQQAAQYMHLMVYGEFVQTPQVDLAHLLSSILPESLNSVYFVNSGAEATEGALKLAKRATGRSKIISFRQSYHGSTHGALSVMGDEYFKQAYRPLLPDVYHIEYTNFDDLNQIDSHTACVVAEAVQAEWGIRVPSIEYMQALRKRCTDVGALLIVDEVQTGFGRTGTMFGFNNWNIVPDIVTFAKGLGFGMPIGAFVADRSLMNCLTHNPVLGHITTFGGHPVSCAGSLAGLKSLLSQPDLLQSVAQKSELFKKLLIHKLILEVRGIGLMMAIDLGTSQKRAAVMHACIAKGLITDFFLFNDRCLRVAPPLIITTEQIETICAIVIDACDEVFTEFDK